MNKPWEHPSKGEVLLANVDVRNKVVVDIGCGGGSLVRLLDGAGADAIGVALSPQARSAAIAKDHARADRYLLGRAEALPLDAASADVAIMSSSFHHVSTDLMGTALDEVARVLVDKGLFCAVEPLPLGPSYQTLRLIEDEREVRVAAQAALDRCVDHELRELTSERFLGAWALPSIEDLEAQILMIDAARKPALRVNQAELREQFERNGVHHQGNYWFEQTFLLRTFARL